MPETCANSVVRSNDRHWSVRLATTTDLTWQRQDSGKAFHAAEASRHPLDIALLGDLTAPVARCARSARYVQAAARASNRRLSTPRGWVTPGPGRDARGSCEPRAAPVVTSGLPLTLGIMPNMGRDWIDEGLRQTPEREQQWQLALERRRRQAATIAAKAPGLMRRLVAEVGAALDEYRKKSLVRADDIEFEPLPHEGFSITKASHPSVSLECRPSYEGQVLCCNLSRNDRDEGEIREWAFNLHFTVDDSDAVALRHEDRIFQNASDPAEFLLKPVLFPPPNPPL